MFSYCKQKKVVNQSCRILEKKILKLVVAKNNILITAYPVFVKQYVWLGSMVYLLLEFILFASRKTDLIFVIHMQKL